MSRVSFFENFSEGPNAPKQQSEGQSDPLEGYETGYQAGWDDAVKAHRHAQTHLSSTLSQNLEQIEFTLVEAQTQLLSTIKPVIKEIADTLIPGIAHEGLRALIVSEIDTLLKTSSPKEISLQISEKDEATIASFLNSSRALSEIFLVVKDTLAEGQAYVSCAEIRRKVDVGQALTEIQARFDSFLNQPELEQANGR